MQYISSDTNVWIDFSLIDELALPFRLPYVYLMYKETVEDELLKPVGLGDELLDYGLESVDITLDEFLMTEKYSTQYNKLSVHDCIALAIAKRRGIVLLTGDKALRSAAVKENVSVIGTIGILDELYKGEYVNSEQYKKCLERLSKLNGSTVRLPEDELQKRLDNI